jgi:hypothetical protein
VKNLAPKVVVIERLNIREARERMMMWVNMYA